MLNPVTARLFSLSATACQETRFVPYSSRAFSLLLSLILLFFFLSLFSLRLLLPLLHLFTCFLSSPANLDSKLNMIVLVGWFTV